MSEVESLVQSRTGLRHLQLITTLLDSEHLDGSRQVGTDALYQAAKEKGEPRSSVSGDLEALQDRGWLWFERMNAGILSVVLNQAGVDVAEEFKDLRSNRKRRNHEARRAVLRWLEDEYHEGTTSPNIVGFSSSKHGNFMGDPYSETEVDAAINWCREEGYLEGTAVFGGGVARLDITNKGLAFIEGGGNPSPAESRPAGDTYNINNTGAFNWAQNSSNVTQSNTLTQSQVEDVERILGLVRTMLTPHVIGVADDAAAAAQVIVGQVEEVVQSSAPSGGKVKALLMKLMELAATGTVQTGVDALNSMIQQGINGIG